MLPQPNLTTDEILPFGSTDITILLVLHTSSSKVGSTI